MIYTVSTEHHITFQMVSMYGELMNVREQESSMILVNDFDKFLYRIPKCYFSSGPSRYFTAYIYFSAYLGKYLSHRKKTFYTKNIKIDELNIFCAIHNL